MTTMSTPTIRTAVQSRPARRRVIRPTRLLLWAAAVVLAVFALLPMLAVVSDAFKSEKELYRSPRELFPAHPTLKNFTYVVGRGNFLAWLGNSVLVSICTVAIGLLIGVMAGYALSRFQFRGKLVVVVALLATQMFPSASCETS